jgi:hypothetical protein
MPTAARRRPLAALPFILLLFLAGCSSEPRDEFAGPHHPPPPPLAGQDTFFDGQILAVINVGSDGMPEVGPSDRSAGGHDRPGGSLNVRGGGGEVAGNISTNVPFGGGGRSHHAAHDQGSERAGAPPLAGDRPGRPVMIHLRFTNLGTAAVTLHIDDFASPLGDFAVRPEKLVLEPGQTLEMDPMASQLAGTFAEIEATLRLRLGAKAEKKSLLLRAPSVAPAPEK